jgi:hypothetical protein
MHWKAGNFSDVSLSAGVIEPRRRVRRSRVPSSHSRSMLSRSTLDGRRCLATWRVICACRHLRLDEVGSSDGFVSDGYVYHARP